MHSILRGIGFIVSAYILIASVLRKWLFIGYVSHMAIDIK
jgi:hypothetical protein